MTIMQQRPRRQQQNGGPKEPTKAKQITTRRKIKAPPEPRSRVDLVDETGDKKLFATMKKFKGKTYEKYKFILKNGPQFTLEPTNGSGDIAQFIMKTRNDKLLGVISNGELQRSDKIEKLYYFSKLDLKPKHTNNYNGHSNNGDSNTQVTTKSSELWCAGVKGYWKKSFPCYNLKF